MVLSFWIVFGLDCLGFYAVCGCLIVNDGCTNDAHHSFVIGITLCLVISSV